MAYLYFKVDDRAVKKVLNERVPARADVQAKATSIVNNIFARAHDSLLREFFEHPITQELKAGNRASNVSDTLNGEGNLFAFLGFYAGQDPTWEIEDLLYKIQVRETQQRGNVINFRIENIPTKTQISSASRMTWGNTSWAYAVENGDFRGDADLAHFIFKNWGSSRSLEGLQVKGYEYSEEKFSPRPYISEIMDNFRDRVNGTNSKFIV